MNPLPPAFNSGFNPLEISTTATSSSPHPLQLLPPSPITIVPSPTSAFQNFRQTPPTPGLTSPLSAAASPSLPIFSQLAQNVGSSAMLPTPIHTHAAVPQASLANVVAQQQFSQFPHQHNSSSSSTMGVQNSFSANLATAGNFSIVQGNNSIIAIQSYDYDNTKEPGEKRKRNSTII